jgi:putative heme iron utilization protein
MTDTHAPSPPFDPSALGKHLLRSVRVGALATLDREEGFPFASLVTVATDYDGSPLFLMSRLSAHTLNLERDPRASLLLAETGKGDPLAHARLTVVGHAARSGEPHVRSRFLARHPKARLYADFADFSFWRLSVTKAHLNGGFARAAALPAADLATDLDGALDLIAAAEGAVTHMNEDHSEALALYATRLAGAPPGAWQATGIDPEGIDLMAGDRTARVVFPERVRDAGSLRRTLVAMADGARAIDAPSPRSRKGN